MTEKEYDDTKFYWMDLGKRNARKDIIRDLANALGLYELFETKKEDY